MAKTRIEKTCFFKSLQIFKNMADGKKHAIGAAILFLTSERFEWIKNGVHPQQNWISKSKFFFSVKCP